jgi:uncharacterized protein DUF4403
MATARKRHSLIRRILSQSYRRRADATVHVWGRPVLDQANQILRFTDVTLDVQSQAAFGLAGAAAQAALPHLQKMLADKAVIDLKPFAEDAKKRIGAAVSGFTQQGSGMNATVAINDLRLVGVAYDDKTASRASRSRRWRCNSRLQTERTASTTTFVPTGARS